MGKGNVQEIKEVMKRFDPLLVAVAIGEIGVKSKIIDREVANIKAAFAKFEKKLVAKAAADYVNANSIAIDCGGPVCICPENGGCGRYAVRIDERSVRELGFSVVTAVRDLNKSKGASAVVGVGDKLGYAALCWDTVRCTGKQIHVMHPCLASLYTFDIGEDIIDPVDAILTIAKSNPALSKRVNTMIEAMKKAGELPK